MGGPPGPARGGGRRAALPALDRHAVARATTAELAVAARDTAGLGLALRSYLEIGAGGLVLLRHELTNDGPAAASSTCTGSRPRCPCRGPRTTSRSSPAAGPARRSPSRPACRAAARPARPGAGASGHDAPWVTAGVVGHAAEPDRRGVGHPPGVERRRHAPRGPPHRAPHAARRGRAGAAGRDPAGPGETYRTPVAYFAWSPAGPGRRLGPVPHLDAGAPAARDAARGRWC